MRHSILIALLLVSNQFIYAAEPTNQPTSFSSSNIKPWQFTINFNASSGGATGYLILRGNQAVSQIPTDGIEYKRGQALGNAKVFYAGNLTSIDIKECIANTKYYFAIFAYNGFGASIDYKTNNPLIDSTTTTGSNIGNYYGNIKPSNLNFLSDLTTKLNNHIFMSYDDYEKKLVPDFYQRDTFVSGSDKGVVTCEYSGEIKTFTKPFDFANTISLDYSREHVLCKNWMNKRGIPNGDLIQFPEGADYHNLMLTKTTNVNSQRSDYPYGKVINQTTSYLNCKYGRDASNNFVFEPQDISKGNGARCMFYEMVCYNGMMGNWGLDNLGGKASSQDQAVLKSWHVTDQVDNFEIARHEYIFSLQNNRNPFIDYPAWADCINFRSITKLACAAQISSNREERRLIDIISDIHESNIALQFNYDRVEEFELTVYDLQGAILYNKSIEFSIGQNNHIIEFERPASGLYILHFKNESSSITHKIIAD